MSATEEELTGLHWKRTGVSGAFLLPSSVQGPHLSRLSSDSSKKTRISRIGPR